jgi:hypothetical protein
LLTKVCNAFYTALVDNGFVIVLKKQAKKCKKKCKLGWGRKTQTKVGGLLFLSPFSASFGHKQKKAVLLTAHRFFLSLMRTERSAKCGIPFQYRDIDKEPVQKGHCAGSSL